MNSNYSTWYYRVLLLVSVLINITFSTSFSQNSNIEKITLDTSIAADATPAVVARVLNISKNNITEIIFEKGIYHFYPDKGYEKYCYISNHGDLMTNTPFPILNMENVTIDGQGSTFIFHGIMIPFLVEDSKNINIKNLKIDWHQSFHSEGLIVANDEKNKTFDMSISEEYPYEIRNGEIFFIKEYYQHSLGQNILFDPKRKAIAFNQELYSSINTKAKTAKSRGLERINYKYEYDSRDIDNKLIGLENKVTIKELSPGLVRVIGHNKQMPPVGYILTMKGEQGLNRVSPAFRVIYTSGFNASNVTVHHAGGMGIIAENSEDLILDNFNVTPSHNRMVSTTADATHFVGCRGKVILRNCTFQNQLDDAANIHGTYQKITDILDDYRIGVRMMHHQQKGFVIGKTGDTLGLVRLQNSFFPFEKMTIKKVEYLNNRYQIITLNEKLPKTLNIDDLIENLNAYPDLLIENCNISNNRARGLLISNPKKTVIRNNFFSTQMEAILLPVESSFWFESGNAANVLISGNTFQDCQHGGLDRAVIRLQTDDDNKNIAFKNLAILNNTFNHFDNFILDITNADGVKFEGNKISISGVFPSLFPNNPVIKIQNSKNITFKNNQYTGKAKVQLESDGKAKTIFD